LKTQEEDKFKKSVSFVSSLLIGGAIHIFWDAKCLFKFIKGKSYLVEQLELLRQLAIENPDFY
jgi:hypothetical protein|tara:strand:+ start:354 stop:542 length:189 start_codon:yes stop_codon:yes gene_type:complete